MLDLPIGWSSLSPAYRDYDHWYSRVRYQWSPAWRLCWLLRRNISSSFVCAPIASSSHRAGYDLAARTICIDCRAPDALSKASSRVFLGHLFYVLPVPPPFGRYEKGNKLIEKIAIGGTRIIKWSYVHETHFDGLRNAIENPDCGLHVGIADHSGNRSGGRWGGLLKRIGHRQGKQGGEHRDTIADARSPLQGSVSYWLVTQGFAP